MSYADLTQEELIAAYKVASSSFAQAEGMEKGIKVILNAAYGATSNEYFRFYDDRLAEAITLSGQLSVRWIARVLNAFLNRTLGTEGRDYAIALDTDSCYLNLEDVVARACEVENVQDIVAWLDKLSKQRITPVINQGFQELAELMNAFEQKMHMKREGIANKAIWTAKKRYIMNLYNEEGVAFDEPEVKIVGIEAVRSTTPEVCRDQIKEALRVIMNEGEPQAVAFIEAFKKEFLTLSFEEVAFPTGINGVEEYSHPVTIYQKGAPIHVRAALTYNRAIKDRGIKTQPIKSGDKIRYAYLKQPNPYHENVIAVGVDMPDELEIPKYLDYYTQFEKTFMAPLQKILDTIGWRSQNIATLEL